MRKSKFSEEQIIGILKQAEAGAAVTDVCRQHGISGHTFYRWRSKYGGLEVNEGGQWPPDQQQPPPSSSASEQFWSSL